MLDYADTEGKLADVPVGGLFLDERNPRLVSYDAPSQDAILEVLAREMSIDEVAISIAENGYYPTERLLVVERDPGPPTTYTVVEGNRRLAAVQVLLDDAKRQKTRTRDLPRLSAARRQELQTLPVSIFPNREQLWPYLGFKHVNGPREWDAFAKAEFVAMVNEQYGVPVDEISRRIGDRFSTVQRIHLGFRLVRQAEASGVFDREDRFYEKRFYFSHLYTAADQRQFREFLGITNERAALPYPVPSDKINQLRELLTWIYGSRSQGLEPLVQTQNPDLNYLREAVTDESAVAALRQGSELRRASEIARGDDVVFRELLVAAKDSLLDVSKFVRLGYQGEQDLLTTAAEIFDLADDLYDRMSTIQRRSSGNDRRRRSRSSTPVSQNPESGNS